VREEYEVLSKEKDKNQLFQLVDQEERELFAHLTSAVKNSHEKERTQANNTKYWSLIASCVGALLGILGTVINYQFRSKQYDHLLQLAEDNQKQLVDKIVQLESNVQENMQDAAKYLQALMDLSDKIGDDVAFLRFNSQKQVDGKQQEKPVNERESWAGYIKRHFCNVVSFVIPIH
jgi:hypothetical protein